MPEEQVSEVKLLTKEQLAAAESCFSKLLEGVNPKLAEVLRKRYDEDTQNFIEAAEKALPSSEPSYWAKSGCKRCYGRGIIGVLHSFAQPAQSTKKAYSNSNTSDKKCGCWIRPYRKWLGEFRLKFNEGR